MRRRSISLSVRFSVLKRDGFRCRYCGVAAQDARLHVDHITPFSAGGGNEPENLAAACVACNTGKYNYPLGASLLLAERLAVYEDAISDYWSAIYRLTFRLYNAVNGRHDVPFTKEEIDAARQEFESAVNAAKDKHEAAS